MDDALLREFVGLTINEGVRDWYTTVASRKMVNDIRSWLQGDHTPARFKYPGIKLSPGQSEPSFVLNVTLSGDDDSHVDGRYYVAYDTIIIDVEMPVDVKHMAWIVTALKQSIRHELEHAEQMRNDTLPADYITQQDNIVGYLLQQHEMEAFIAGAYKEAKARRVPMSRTLNRLFKDIIDELVPRGNTRSGAQGIVAYIRPRWLSYARKRFPRAQLD